jgi:predicted PurR-regulated permease PerM
MNKPTNPSDDPPSLSPAAVNRLIKPWFSFAVVGLFVFACFYTLKVAKDLFLPIVLAGFLGFLLTPVTRWLRKIGLSEFWAPLVGTLGFLAILLSLAIASPVST